MENLPFTRKQLIMISGGFGIVIVLMGIWAYFAIHQYLTITYDASIYKSVVLYQGAESSSEKTIAPTKTVVKKKIESGKTYHLSKGKLLSDCVGRRRQHEHARNFAKRQSNTYT